MLPQAPQLFGSLSTGTSQPSVRLLPLQSSQPAAHVPVHVPDAQDGVAMWLLEHAAPHAPQASKSVSRSVSQPFATSPSQSPKSALQAPMAQMPSEQTGVAFARTQEVSLPAPSTVPSQSSSMPLHTSVPAVPGVQVCVTPPTHLLTVTSQAPTPQVVLPSPSSTVPSQSSSTPLHTSLPPVPGL